MAGEKLNVRLYRLFRGGVMASSTVLITTRDRTTGEPHTVQVGCTRDGNTYLVAPKMKDGKEPSWFRNLVADPHADVQAGGKQFRARGDRLSDEETRALGKEPPVIRLVPE